VLDGYNREITYLRIAVTDRCDLRCTYCRGGEAPLSETPSPLLSRRDIRAVAEEAARLGFTKVRLTGGEPLLRPDVVEIVRDLSSVPGLREITMTTNGTRLESTAEALKRAGLTRLNISLDSLDPAVYRRITGGDIRAVLAGVEAAEKAGFRNTKINMVVMKDVNAHEIPDMKRFCAARDLRLQLIAHFRLSDRKPPSPPPGFDRPPSCTTCNRIRLTADGVFKPCLFSDLAVPLDRNDIAGSLARAVRLKPERGTVSRHGAMLRIGG